MSSTTRSREVIGESARRVDGVPKVTGDFAFGSDLRADNMLWGVTVRSPHASAKILSIDLAAAAQCPGVAAVLTAADVPGLKTFGLEFCDQPVLAHDVIRYVGEAVALVAAETPEQARAAAAEVVVRYEPLPVVADMEQALRPDSPRVHDFGNVLRHVHIVSGNPDTVEADVWVDGYYETAMQDQAALGPEAGLAVPAADGGIDLYAVTQWLHVDRQQIAPCLDLPEEKVRITLAGVGGAFGSREDLTMQLHACLLALRTRRPVKMSYGREESFHGHVHRHPSRTWIRYGATKDGRLVAADVRLLLDGGAYASSSPAVIVNASTFAAGPYEVPNVRVEGTVVYTNNPPCGAMRGFGAPQVCFAYESAMDVLAGELGIDPLELRLRNVLHTGSVLPTGQVLTGSAPAREVLERCASIPLPEPEPELGRDPIAYPGGAGNVSRGESLKRGVGFALGFKNIAYSEGFDDASEATVTLRPGPDGPVAVVHTAAVEYGQGLTTVLGQIVRTELGVDEVVFEPASVEVGSAGSTSASRQTTMTGGAVLGACREVRAERDARGLDEPITRTFTYHHRATTGIDENGQGDVHVSFAFAAERAVVEVDEELGLVRVAPDRGGAGRRPRHEPARRRGAGRGRHGAGDRARADGRGEARGRDHPQRLLHRLSDPDHPRRADGGDGVRRGAGARRALRSQGDRRARHRRGDAGRRGRAARRRRPPAQPGAGDARGPRRPPAARLDDGPRADSGSAGPAGRAGVPRHGPRPTGADEKE